MKRPWEIYEPIWIKYSPGTFWLKESTLYGWPNPNWLYRATKHWTFGICFKHRCKRYPDFEWYYWKCPKCSKR